MNSPSQNRSIQELSEELFSAVLQSQTKFNSILPPNPDKTKQQDHILEKFSQMRGRPFIYPYISTGKGHGPFTELVDGSVKYDLIGGIGPNLLGHSHPLFIRSYLEAAEQDAMMCGNLLPYQESYELTETLLSRVNKSNLKHFWFAGSGSFANDTALKLLWQKKEPNYKVIAFQKAFAGRSIATQDITDNSKYRQGMPKSLEVFHVPHFNQNDPENSLQATLDALDKVWKEQNGEFCAMMIELIQGEGGFIYGTQEYYEGIFKWAKDKGIYIWVDEIQTFGRTHELFAFQHFKLDKYVDIVTVGKALQACGVLFSQELNPKPGLIAGTFNGSLSSLKAGRKLIDFLSEGNFFGDQGRIAKLGTAFLNNLNELKTKHDNIGHVGGIGTMISFEVGDATKETTLEFVKTLFSKGVIGFVAGQNPTRVRFLLPVTLNEAHIKEIFQVLDQTLKEFD